MDRIKLTPEKLIEIANEISNEESMEKYYKIALNDGYVANCHMALVSLLLIFIIHKREKLFSNKNFNIENFLGMKHYNERSEYWKFGELLKKTNMEILYGLISGEPFPEETLVAFCETYALHLFCIGDYFGSLRICENALRRDENNSWCNFLKASIIELCYINKWSPICQCSLLNYQKELIDKCNPERLPFGREIYDVILKNINNKIDACGGVCEDVKLTKIADTYKDTCKAFPGWLEEYDFYLRKNLLLNPLTNFSKSVEAANEELHDLPIDEKFKEYFDEIIADFKMCRRSTFLFYKGDDNVGEREMAMAYSYAYSILDKISFLIKNVYDLDVHDDRVYFNDKSLFRKTICGTSIRFKELKNVNIIPLFLITKKAKEKLNIEEENIDAIQTGTFEHYELRNTIEHKSIALVDRRILRRNADYLMELIRDAILYTYMLLNSYSLSCSYNDTVLPKTSFFDAFVEMANIHEEKYNV